MFGHYYLLIWRILGICFEVLVTSHSDLLWILMWHICLVDIKNFRIMSIPTLLALLEVHSRPWIGGTSPRSIWMSHLQLSKLKFVYLEMDIGFPWVSVSLNLAECVRYYLGDLEFKAALNSDFLKPEIRCY